jgi:hypothetical protein
MMWLDYAREAPFKPTIHSGYLFPAEIVQHTTSLYHVFSLSLCHTHPLLAEQACWSAMRRLIVGAFALTPTWKLNCASGGQERGEPG